MIRLLNGKFWLVGGKPLLITPGVVPLTTSLTLVDFSGGNTESAIVIQRKAGALYADVRVLFSFAGEAPSVQARVEKKSTGATVKDWTTLSTINTNGTTGVGTLMGVPQGGDYIIKIRDAAQPANSATLSTGTRQWGVGVCVLMIGQSNQGGMLQGGQFDAQAPGKGMNEFDYCNSTTGRTRASFFADCGFYGASNGAQGPIPSLPGANNSAVAGSTAVLRILADRLEAKYGYPVPVAMSPWFMGQTGIDQWDPATSGGWLNKLLYNTGTAAGGATNAGFSSPSNVQPGDFELVMMHQGEANQGGTRAGYLAAMKTAFLNTLAFVAPFGRTAANFGYFPSMLGSYAAGQVDNAENIRGAQLDFETWAHANGYPNAGLGLNCIDLDSADTAAGSDGIHFGNAIYGRIGLRRQIQTMLKFLGCATVSGLGPRISGISRNGLTVNVTVVHEGGSGSLTTRAGGAPSGHYFNSLEDFSGTSYPATAAITSDTNIAVTRNDGLSPQGLWYKHCGGLVGSAQSYHPAISNVVVNMLSYPTGAIGTDVFVGLPLLPTPDAILVN